MDEPDGQDLERLFQKTIRRRGTLLCLPGLNEHDRRPVLLLAGDDGRVDEPDGQGEEDPGGHGQEQQQLTRLEPGQKEMLMEYVLPCK